MEKREEERKKEKSDDPFKWWNDNVKKNILYFQPYLHTHYIFFIFLVVKPAIAASATFLPSEIGKKFEFYQSNKKTNANELKNKKKNHKQTKQKEQKPNFPPKNSMNITNIWFLLIRRIPILLKSVKS